MRQNVARKQCTTTPQAIGKATRRSQKQPDTQREGPVKLKIYWARAPHGCNRGGGREATTRPQPDNEKPKHKGGGKQKTQRRNMQSRCTQASTERQTAKTHKSGSKQRAEQGTTQRRGKHSHQGVLDRGWIRKGACNTLPQNHKAGEGRKSTGTQVSPRLSW